MPEGADEADVRRLTSGVVYEDAWMRLRRDEIERCAHGISSQGPGR